MGAKLVITIIKNHQHHLLSFDIDIMIIKIIIPQFLNSPSSLWPRWQKSFNFLMSIGWEFFYGTKHCCSSCRCKTLVLLNTHLFLLVNNLAFHLCFILFQSPAYHVFKDTGNNTQAETKFHMFFLSTLMTSNLHICLFWVSWIYLMQHPKTPSLHICLFCINWI
jgi:hypothetical protein